MTNSYPLVSIIMNCFNGEKYLDKAVQSIIQQSYENWELIFWDNQSNDRSSEIIKSFRDKRIKYFYSDNFTDLGGARAKACKFTKGEYLAILDTDDIWFPNKLKNQLNYFSDPEVGICLSNTLFFNNKKKNILYNRNPPVGTITKNLIENYYISLEATLLKMKFIKKLDIFFDKRFSHIADFDLITRLSTICKLTYCSEILSGWRIHDQNASFTESEKFLKEKIKWINIYKNSEIFANYQDSISNLDISMRAESIYSNTKYKKLNLRDALKYSGKLSSKIKIFCSLFPFMRIFLSIYKKIIYFKKWI